MYPGLAGVNVWSSLKNRMLWGKNPYVDNIVSALNVLTSKNIIHLFASSPKNYKWEKISSLKKQWDYCLIGITTLL